MKTLVIHSPDPSTDVLKLIYKDKDWTVINDYNSNKEIIEAIKAHDRIIMLGHGIPNGLIGKQMSLVINSSHVYLLREKYCIGIWCNADQFFKRYGLKGKYTGMIISEVEEAEYCGVAGDQAQVDVSIELFTILMTEFVDERMPLNEVIDQYKNENNPITDFNRIRIFDNTFIN